MNTRYVLFAKAKSAVPATEDAKARKKTPTHVYLDPSARKYPYKRKKNGKWVISRSDLKSAIDLANMHKRPDIAAKARRLLEKHFGKKKD